VDGGERPADLVRGDGEELVARAERLLRPAVEARVLDGERGPARQLGAQLEVLLPVPAVRRGDEGERTGSSICRFVR